MHQVVDPSLPNELASLEIKESNSKFKIGVLYMKENQSEEEMFSNVEMSADFQDFLKIIGTKIELKSHSGFTGGLDIKRKLLFPILLTSMHR